MKFPIIEKIDDVLPFVEDCPEIAITKKDGYTVATYMVQNDDTFGALTGDPELDRKSLIRRECRGLIFDTDGKLVSRPYNKFFNIGEREETLPEKLDFSAPHHIMEKLDGSMIRPFKIDGEVLLGTKAGVTEISQYAANFIHRKVNYWEFFRDCLKEGYTPILEYMSYINRVVVSYPEESLVLTGIRNMRTGDYLGYHEMRNTALRYEVPVVDVIEPFGDPVEFLKHTRSLVDKEGYVVVFGNNYRVKAKGEWYTNIHKAKEGILYPRHVVVAYMEDRIDDIIPFLNSQETNAVKDVEANYIRPIFEKINHLADKSYQLVKVQGIDRKDFGMHHAKDFGVFGTIVFQNWGNLPENSDTWRKIFVDEAKKIVLRKCNSNSSLENLINGVRE